MKTFRLTWFLGGLLLLVGLYVYFIEIKGAEKKKIAEEKKERLFSFEMSQVASVTLSNTEGHFVAKRIGETDWVLEKPITGAADKETWNKIVTKLQEFKPSRILSENESDLKPYGLDKPDIEIEVKLTNSDRAIALKIGDENPIGDSYFITDHNEKRVMLATKGVEYAFSKNLTQLRNKKLFKFDTTATKEIEIHKNKKRLVLKKEGETWSVVSGAIKQEADVSKVDQILRLLSGLEVKVFEDKAPEDLSRYGLKKPDIRVVLRSNKTTQLEIHFGKKEEAMVYVMKKAEKPVYKVHGFLLSRISTDASKIVKIEEKKVPESKEEGAASNLPSN